MKSAQNRLPRDLNAVSATIILFGYLIAPALCILWIAVIAILVTRLQGIHANDQILRVIHDIMPAISILTPFISGGAAVLISLWLIPKSLKDTSPNGAAWVRGSWRAIAEGFVIGVILGAVATVMSKAMTHHVDYRDMSPVVQMLLRPGLLQVLSAVSIVLCGPPAEEIVFRGVLFGGYRKSFGPIWATLLTTLLFLALHLPKVLYYMPALAGASGASLAALWCRLRSGAIGPAVALHVGYNALALSFF